VIKAKNLYSNSSVFIKNNTKVRVAKTMIKLSREVMRVIIKNNNSLYLE
jgi:archaellum component FlaF (FlaF/FlaG flagellin family)